MAKRELSPKLIPKTYAELRDAEMAVVVDGRRAIDRAWVESYHKIGRLIYEYQLLKKERATYGAGVFAQLPGRTHQGRRWRHAVGENLPAAAPVN